MKNGSSFTIKLCALILAIGLFGCASTKPKAPTPPAQVGTFKFQQTLTPYEGMNIHVYRHTATGLEAMLVPMAETGVVAYVTAYDVGSRFESKGHTGIAHLFEHMMFRGTESFPEPFKTLSGWGGKFNAYTNFDLTLYHELVPKNLLPQVAKFESERMRKLLITPEGFNTERGAVVSERKMRVEDNPMGRMFWELHQLAFDDHPYKTTPIGWQADLDKTSFQDALNFYNRFYAPNRALIAIVGEIDLTETLKILDQNYGSFQPSNFDAPKVPQEKIHKSSRRKIVSMRTESVLIAEAAMGSRYDDPNAPADSLMCVLLADDKMGYLSRELVETGLARSVGADCSPSVDPDMATVFVSGSPGVPMAKLEAAFNKALKEFPKWVTAEKIEHTKLFYQAEQIKTLREPMGLGEQLARLAVVAKNPLWDFQFVDRLAKVDEAQVRVRFTAWSTAKHSRLVIVPEAKATQGKRAKK